MTDSPEGLPAHATIDLPDAQAAGVHADAASVWHTTESIVIDFLAYKQPPHAAPGPDGSATLLSELLVTSRVRMAPTHVIELMKALEQQLTRWETESGHRPPVDPLHPDL